MKKEIVFHYNNYICCLYHQINTKDYWNDEEDNTIHIDITKEKLQNLAKNLLKMSQI